jgi:hypothetical protein
VRVGSSEGHGGGRAHVRGREHGAQAVDVRGECVEAGLDGLAGVEVGVERGQVLVYAVVYLRLRSRSGL